MTLVWGVARDDVREVVVRGPKDREDVRTPSARGAFVVVYDARHMNDRFVVIAVMAEGERVSMVMQRRTDLGAAAGGPPELGHGQ